MLLACVRCDSHVNCIHKRLVGTVAMDQRCITSLAKQRERFNCDSSSIEVNIYIYIYLHLQTSSFLNSGDNTGHKYQEIKFNTQNFLWTLLPFILK